jgi:metal-responsive CopG/Arc/MetJ family transcriptional regulator
MARPKGSLNKEKRKTMDHQVGVRLPDDLIVDLDAEAIERGVNKVSTLIRMILVERQSKKKGA